MRAVLRMLGGEEESRLSVELGVPAHRLEEWRRLFVGAGERELRRAEGEPSDPALFRAWAKIGQLTLLLDAWKDLLARSGHDSGNR